MDVEIAIRYSDERPCVVTVSRPDGKVVFCTLTPLADIPDSVAEGLREARRVFEAAP